jgi:hypothetical protein
MTRIIADARLREKLRQFTEAVELCDESGRVLGRVLPAPNFLLGGSCEPQISEDELDRREQETESYPTAEVLAYLEKL